LIWTYAGPGTGFAGRWSSNWKVGIEAGYLTNLNEGHAMGFTLFALYWDETGSEFGARFVYRRWLSSQVGLDLAPGIVLYADEQQVPGFSGQVALDLAGLIAPMAQIDMVREDDQVHWSLMGGIRTGSYLGFGAGVLIMLGAIAYATAPD